MKSMLFNTSLNPQSNQPCTIGPTPLEYWHLSKSPKHQQAWIQSFANELGCLAQGIDGCETGTNTVFFIPHNQVPPDQRKDVTYGQICVNYRPHKKEPNRTRLTVGGNLINFPGDVSTPTTDTTTAKLIINSTILTPNTCYMCADIKTFTWKHTWNGTNT